MPNRIQYILFLCSLLIAGGCEKYLDKKSNQNLSVPDNLEDLGLILDDGLTLNNGVVGANAAADEYYLNSNDWEGLDVFNKQTYTWESLTQDTYDWNQFYRAIFTVNTVLENLEKIDRNSDPATWDTYKGSALFFRAFSYFQLAQVYAPPYPRNENSEYGLPIRLSSDFNKPVTRSTLRETYDQIFTDLQHSITLLPLKRSLSTQPSRWAAYAMLARLHLLLENYQQAYDYSDSALGISATLLDFNTIDGSQEFPFPRLNSNPEVIFHVMTESPVNAYYWMAKVDSTLINMFDTEDLRRELFFTGNGDGSWSFKGNYTNSYYLFNGLATDEIYLTRSEAAIRLNLIPQALDALNELLQSRWKKSKYEPVTESDPEKLLALVLQERRKELIARGLRWSDLRRLNRDARFRTTLVRKINGQQYTLAPNDPRYVFLIPQQSINASSLKQNPR
jgi:starch-binding outer membrane protein, SusD/RagB family